MRKSAVAGFVIASLLTLGTIAQAQSTAPVTSQDRQQRRGRVEGGRGRLLHGIKLSDAEKARVKEIRTKYRTESTADRQNRQELRQRQLAEIRTVLSPEQQTKFDANVKQLAERRAGRKNGRKGHRAPTAARPGINKS
jgi:Spy/CpxP family protein refolding chaperone